MTTTILTDEQVVTLAYQIDAQPEITMMRQFARAVEQAVLQSEQVQAWKKDAERYRATRAGLVGVDPDYGNRFCSYCDAEGIKQSESITEDQFDAATDAAMEKQP